MKNKREGGASGFSQLSAWRALALLGGLVIVGAHVSTLVHVEALRSELSTAFKPLLRNMETTQSFETEWTSDGVLHRVTTPRIPDEDLADWAQRHADAVRALQAIFPA